MAICLEQGADLHMAQLMPLPLAVSCFSKIQTDCTFSVPAHPGSPRQRTVKKGVYVLLLIMKLVQYRGLSVIRDSVWSCFVQKVQL